MPSNFYAGVRHVPVLLTILAACTFFASDAASQDGPRRLVPLPSAPTTTNNQPPTVDIEATELQEQGVAALSLQAPVCDLPWRDTDRDEIDLALAAIPNHSTNPVVRKLAAKALAPGIETTGEQQSLVGRRLELLLGHGQLDLFDALLAMLPAKTVDDAVTGLGIARTLIGGGDPSPQCGTLLDSGIESVEWRIACAAVAKDHNALGLQLSLADDRGLAIDPALAVLAGALIEERDVEPEAILAANRWPAAALLRLVSIAQEPLDPDTTAAAAAVFLADNQTLPGPVRQDFAQRAAAFGFVGVEESARRSAERSTDDLFTALENETVQSARVQLIKDIWQQMPPDRRSLAARLLASDAMEIPLDRAFVWGADALIPILMSENHRDRALAWLALVDRDGARSGLDEATRTRLHILAALADAKLTVDFVGGDPYLFAAMAGLGIDLPIEAVTPVDRVSPSIATWLGLERSLERRACNATLSHVLTLLGVDPSATSPLAITAAIRALMALGQEDEARELAVSIALARPIDQ